jgi:hypothetical protein
MRQSDVVVGQEYAYQTSDPYDGPPTAARVSVKSIDGGGKVTVVVVDPSPKPQYPRETLKRRQTQQISTRSLVCLWDGWQAHASRIADEKAERLASQRRRWEKHEAARADRTHVDPDRPLPDRYEDEDEIRAPRYRDEEESTALIRAYRARVRAERWSDDELAELLAGLPVPVARDLISAAPYGLPDSALGSVGRTFSSAAFLLNQARRIRPDGPAPELPYLHTSLTGQHKDFVHALCDQVAEEGGAISLPHVPRLPSWLDEGDRELVEVFGWLRLAIGDTSGQRLHATSCHTIKSFSHVSSEHEPLWRVALEKRDNICGVCDGPNIRDVLPFAHFTAAVDVWDARDRQLIEPWQRVTFLRLVAVNAAARAELGEPDVTLAARIVDALSQDQPGEEGWAAYALANATWWNRLDESLDKLSPAERDAARLLVRDRLTLVEQQLPASQRPLPLPTTVSEDVLRERHKQIEATANIPQFHRLLFGLPGAR